MPGIGDILAAKGYRRVRSRAECQTQRDERPEADEREGQLSKKLIREEYISGPVHLEGSRGPAKLAGWCRGRILRTRSAALA